MDPDIQDISLLENKYAEEWMLVEVVESDEVDRPLKGRVIHHSPSREEIHEVIMAVRTKDKRFLIKYNGDPIPPDVVAVL